jgi:2-polyprenyl-3-methyl-5-hydroxy-6-metoxy-1,4-benzoquinol methylase
MSQPQAPQEPTLQQQIEFYDRWNADYRAGDLDDIIPEIRRRGLVVCEHLARAGLARPRILEVGCGTGWLSRKLLELGPLTAIDLSPRAIEIARQRHPEPTFIAGDFYAHDFGSEPFDAIVCIETLFYVPDQPRFVAKLAQLLRPGGFLGMSCINKFVYERSSDIGAPQPGQVRHWLTKREILALLRPHFDVQSVETVEPRGDQGIMRLVNSYKLNAMATRAVGSERVRRCKEKWGFGGGIVFVARRH